MSSDDEANEVLPGDCERDHALKQLAASQALLERYRVALEAIRAKTAVTWEEVAVFARRTALDALEAAALQPPTPAVVPACPSHCSFPDTGNVSLCPCDPGDCQACDAARPPAVPGGAAPAVPNPPVDELARVRGCKCGDLGRTCDACVAWWQSMAGRTPATPGGLGK